MKGVISSFDDLDVVTRKNAKCKITPNDEVSDGGGHETSKAVNRRRPPPFAALAWAQLLRALLP